MKLAVMFPIIEIPCSLVMGPCRTHPRDYVANPKAISAQTFKAKSAAFAFRCSNVWKMYGDLFRRQYVINGEAPPVTTLTYNGDWIAYPYAVAPDEPEGSCIVWKETQGEKRIRHIRLCRSEEYALASNRLIAEAIASQFEVI